MGLGKIEKLFSWCTQNSKKQKQIVHIIKTITKNVCLEQKETGMVWEKEWKMMINFDSGEMEVALLGK